MRPSHGLIYRVRTLAIRRFSFYPPDGVKYRGGGTSTNFNDAPLFGNQKSLFCLTCSSVSGPFFHVFPGFHPCFDDFVSIRGI